MFASAIILPYTVGLICHTQDQVTEENMERQVSDKIRSKQEVAFQRCL